MNLQCIRKWCHSLSYKVLKKSKILLFQHAHISQTEEQNEDLTSHHRILNPPKGTRDFTGAEMINRRKIFNHIYEVFKMHGAVEIQTPVFESKELLMGNYGDDSKLIYDIQDKGSQILAMRFDLTVPFARYFATNELGRIKRCQIANVYRRDTPKLLQGRYREFYQADFDIAGHFGSMIPDAECIQVIDQVLTKLDLGKYVIKINHRKLLDEIFSICGVPPEKFLQVYSAVDKLDKISWTEVRQELIEEKGLTADITDRLGEYVNLSGGVELLLKLLNDSDISSSPRVQVALKELLLLYDYCSDLSCEASIKFDICLARGMSYYTGVIFEAVFHESTANVPENLVGSVAGGGRYDKLLGSLNPNSPLVPCVGVSFGIERLFIIFENKLRNRTEKVRFKHSLVLVVSPADCLRQRLRLVSILHNNGIYAETLNKINPNIRQQFHFADENGIPLALVTGGYEESQNIIKIRLMSTRQEECFPADDFVLHLKDKIKKLNLS